MNALYVNLLQQLSHTVPPSYIIPLSTVLTTCLNHTCPDCPGVLTPFYFEKAQSIQYQFIGNFSNEKLCSSHLSSSSFFFPPFLLHPSLSSFIFSLSPFSPCSLFLTFYFHLICVLSLKSQVVFV